ncbi:MULTISPECIES: PD-(D/E)XK nuclease family protein [Comamonas]|uniref:PDDEXK-like family protein n=1 Tax=Comamonas TaxID=283 RepID=UPI001C45D55C|nr:MULTISPECIES: PD-(D/E)XK nuclease family protein [Comamonas]MBV7420096.1 PD-(D/E)XK nuclease family protein [Comamonas sp. CMM03]MDH0050874.1 PD-(D/E)XK nuclease family protein [Comamonas terrigena]MDH0511440.1 PD-(D/E)XK nuclease family protein [Comamonas terrigena]MDH1092307.1 PD-(D/E)XK nuclease family protein [Comamonas terrigena]MDH1502474.1 PD-(D/E)XK nuclease family protein [Comamonas terrigena]
MKEKINEFFADLDVQRLIQLSARVAPLQICFPKEINVSRMLAWLLDPSEGHGLGDAALRSLFARAGQIASRNQNIPLSTRRFLSPSNIYTSGFSGAVVSTEVKIGVSAASKDSLDVFCIDQGADVYLALENKFGAKQSVDQLKKYRIGLENLFPKMIGVHVFLSSSDEEPDDDQWIQVGYDWLGDFLRDCESRSTLALEMRQTLTQFRRAIEEEEVEAGTSPIERLYSLVATRHADVLREMKTMSGAKGAMPKELQKRVEVSKSNNKPLGEAQLRLFLLYWRRPQAWERCFDLVDFAPFLDAMRNRFHSILVDRKRVKTYLSLPEWERFVEYDEYEQWTYPLVVSVQLKDSKFNVTAYCWFKHVKADLREAILEQAKKLRNGHLADSGLEAPNYLAIQREIGLTEKQAVAATLRQMQFLQDGFSNFLLDQ